MSLQQLKCLTVSYFGESGIWLGKILANEILLIHLLSNSIRNFWIFSFALVQFTRWSHHTMEGSSNPHSYIARCDHYSCDCLV